MKNIIETKKLNYLKLLKELYDEKNLSLKKFKKILKRFPLFNNSFLKSKKHDAYFNLYLEDKICIKLLKELYILKSNKALKN